jgi:very-short-patch-repair endonuclease
MTAHRRPPPLRSIAIPAHADTASGSAEPAFPTADHYERIWLLAADQHGVVTRRQLLQLGIGAHIIAYLVRRRRLRPLHRGVYSASAVAGRLQREMAAVLALGDGAVVSHRSAARLWSIMAAAQEDEPVVDVSIARCGRGPCSGVRLHRVIRLPPEECAHVDGVPVTSAARTLLDLAGCVTTRELERAFSHAERAGHAGQDEVATLLEQYGRRPGARNLRALIGNSGPSLTRSDAEARFLDLIRAGRLPAPRANVVVRGYEVDFLWRAERFIAEIDGFAFHGSRDSFERDRRRDAVLTAAGLRVMRVTWRQLTEAPEALLVSITQALAHGPRL